MTNTESKNLPIEIRILYWFGIIFGAMFIFYGLVSIVLSFMDRTYQDIGGNFIILIYGLPFIVAGYGLKNLRKWGWVFYTALMALVLVMSFFSKMDLYGILIIILMGLALVGMMLPSVRKHYFGY